MPTIYKSTDNAAPILEGTSGSLISLLRACLVTGYGVKNPAGWGYTVIDAATYQALFTQGAKEGRVQKHLYIKDASATVGVADAWMCTACTVGASPTFTENFWAGGTTYKGIITKADQERGASAEWMLIADARSAILMTKRSDWGKGWAFTFFGDMDTGMVVDKGCCAAAGWYSNDTPIPAYGIACRAICNGTIGVFGDIDGTFSYIGYTYRVALGYSSGVSNNLFPRNKYNREAHIARVIAAGADRYRGHIPFLWTPVAPAANFSWYSVEDGILLSNVGGGKTFRHFLFSAASGGRLFIDMAEY